MIATQSTDCGARSLHAYACVSLAQTDLPSRLPSQGTLWERSPGQRFIFWTLICTRWCHESRRPRWLRRHTDRSERGKKFSRRRLSSQSLLVRWRCRHRVPSVSWANGTARNQSLLGSERAGQPFFWLRPTKHSFKSWPSNPPVGWPVARPVMMMIKIGHHVAIAPAPC